MKGRITTEAESKAREVVAEVTLAGMDTRPMEGSMKGDNIKKPEIMWLLGNVEVWTLSSFIPGNGQALQEFYVGTLHLATRHAQAKISRLHQCHGGTRRAAKPFPALLIQGQTKPLQFSGRRALGWMLNWFQRRNNWQQIQAKNCLHRRRPCKSFQGVLCTLWTSEPLQLPLGGTFLHVFFLYCI